MLRKVGPDEPAKYNYHFKHMTTVGEPIEPERVALVPRCRRQGRGGHRRHLVADRDRRLPGQHPARAAADEARQLRPGRPRDLPGDLRRERRGGRGRQRPGRQHLHPQPLARASSRPSGASPSASCENYYEKYCRDTDSKDWRDWPYFAGDGAVQAADGYFRILGRVDDVINVAGHRLGNQGARVGRASPSRRSPRPPRSRSWTSCAGRAVEMYVVAQAGLRRRAREIEEKVAKAIETEIGKIARPKNVWIVPDMPKTRSGKIMRRVIAGDLQLRRRRRHDHAGQPRDRRRHPPPRAEREGGPRRGPSRALAAGDRGDQGIRSGRVAGSSPRK